MAETDQVPDDPAEKAKKKAKVRNVWISFAGRIVAQIVGAVASVVLGIMVLQRYNDRPETPAPATATGARSAPAW
jgi:heme A synthase